MNDVAEEQPKRIDCVLVAAGKYHDIDFARLELLKLLGEDMRFRVRVFEDYENLEAIKTADCIVTYTCDVVPSLAAQEALKEWLNAGGRWYALHGTNSILRMLDDGLWDAPRWAPAFMNLLGSQFISHPPIEPYKVIVTQPDHPLVKDVDAFETTD
ncbi:MAG: ThuA domain-containing protein, partial [Pseudomonadota bacterium]|nr:ThuA domain-containing protein [Pseudomonadota bacterium]